MKAQLSSYVPPLYENINHLYYFLPIPQDHRENPIRRAHEVFFTCLQEDPAVALYRTIQLELSRSCIIAPFNVLLTS